MSQTKSQLINPIDGNINVTGIVTATTAIVGSAVTINSSGVNVSGIATIATLNVGVGGTIITTTNTGLIDINSNIFSRALFKNCNETINIVGNTGTASTINLSNGNFVTATLTGNCTFTFNVGITTGAASFTLFLTNDATPGRSIVWPISVKWPNNSVPVRTTAANATDVYTFFTLNAGTNWYGNLSLYNYT
jgi:hypothetical protein